MSHKIHDIGVARHIGPYSDAIEVEPGARWLFTAGTPGMSANGEVPPDIESQSRLAWQNVMKILESAGMTVGDLVKVTTSLTKAGDRPAYVKVRSEFLGAARPAFMLQIVDELIRPDILVEIEIIAART
ncbi:MAG TPA: RidA family protein [Vicinamibacterales bacterium]